MAKSKVEYIGKKVIEHQEERRQFVDMMTPSWTREGA